MGNNSFGHRLILTTFGESHGEAIGGILDGVPSGITLDINRIQAQLQRRRPGQSTVVSPRKEKDEVRLLSGVFEGKTTGAPIGFIIENSDMRSRDYEHLRNAFRPSHADYTYHKKYGHRDHRGGGRSSARETANWVVAGAIAAQIIPQVSVNAFTSTIGTITVDKPYQAMDFSRTDSSPVRCPDEQTSRKMLELLEEIKREGDSIGGKITCVIQGVPAGWGEPVFNKLQAQLAKAVFSIPAVKAFEYGTGFCAAEMRGSEHNDIFLPDGSTRTNMSGGIQGGISNGMDIYFRVGFKPVATIMKEQESIDTEGKPVTIHPRGRHDPCVVPRAVPVVEAMTALVLADFYLLNR